MPPLSGINTLLYIPRPEHVEIIYSFITVAGSQKITNNWWCLNMLPRERERLKEQLLRWGYTLRMLEHMQPWTLLSHYESEKKKRGIKNEQILASNGFNVVDKEKTDDNKYKGASTPYRLKE